MSDLIVIGYPDETTAYNVWDELVKLEKDYLVDLDDAAIGAAGNLGIKGEFKERVQNMVQPGASALLVILRKATPDKFLEALKPYGGTVLQTSLSHDAEQELMKALHGEDRSAPTWEQPQSASATAS
jgi:uncharacterized membrane protein